ncbi:hypothetical protein BDZ90DRAFT_126720 [Jaminaea rosea]|uniref:Uncharacterized protein n=1 Tax=Jaminaea rosea TaxID=1569628 RepID=A0A316UHE5_9BASI|nr:hypothetical protein BDZ90DRAFT_126720 [Jaminaea rosea]PWN24328.1 hypothetical protein BDZ90DRAFT_126720 [Jaminaea rosea]
MAARCRLATLLTSSCITVLQVIVVVAQICLRDLITSRPTCATFFSLVCIWVTAPLTCGSERVPALFLTLSVGVLRSRGWARDVDPEMRSDLGSRGRHVSLLCVPDLSRSRRRAELSGCTAVRRRFRCKSGTKLAAGPRSRLQAACIRAPRPSRLAPLLPPFTSTSRRDKLVRRFTLLSPEARPANLVGPQASFYSRRSSSLTETVFCDDRSPSEWRPSYRVAVEYKRLASIRHDSIHFRRNHSSSLAAMDFKHSAHRYSYQSVASHLPIGVFLQPPAHKFAKLRLTLVLSSSLFAFALSIVGLYSARIQPIKLYQDGTSASSVYDVFFGLLASVIGGLIAIGFGAGLGAVLTKRFSARGAEAGQWLLAPEALRGRPTWRAGPLLLCVSIIVAMVYALSHAAATTLLAPVRTVFNETWAGQYSVGRRFDVALTSLSSVDAVDLSGHDAAEVLQMYPIYLALGLNPATTRIADTFGPLAFTSLDQNPAQPYVELNMSQYMVVDAPLIHASCVPDASCATLSSRCNLTVGWSEQVLYRLPDTTLTLGKHEGIQSVWQRTLNLSSLQQETMQLCSSSDRFKQSATRFLEVAALAAYNKTINGDQRAFATSSTQVNRKRATSIPNPQASIIRHPEADPAWHSPKIGVEQTGLAQVPATLFDHASSSTPLAPPTSEPSVDAPARTPEDSPSQTGTAYPEQEVHTPQQQQATPSETPIGAPATLPYFTNTNERNNVAATTSPAATQVVQQAQSQTTPAPVVPAPVQASSSISAAQDLSSQVGGFGVIQTTAAAGTGTDASGRIIKVISPSATSTATDATGSTAPSSASSSSRGSSDLSVVLSALPGTLIHSVDYWCLFTLPSQEWYCAMLLAIASACLVMAAACLRAPGGIDASSGGSVGLAVAQSEAARIGLAEVKSEKELSRRVDAYSRGMEEGRLGWFRTPGGRAKLYPVTS